MPTAFLRRQKPSTPIRSGKLIGHRSPCRASNAIVDAKYLCSVNHKASFSKRVSAFSFISIGYSFIDLSSFTIKKLRFCSLSFSECSGQISRKTVDSTYPINSFQDAGFSGKTCASFHLLRP